MLKLISAMVVVATLAACAARRDVPAGNVAYDTPENFHRLQRVLGPLAIANAPLCRDTIGVMTSPSGAPACAISAGVSKFSTVNAWTDGTNLVITRPMLAMARTDDELAYVMAHELAHVLREHVQQAKAGKIAGSALDLAAVVFGVNTDGAFGKAGARVFSKDREREADHMGAYLMSRAGFDPRAGAAFWDHMPPGGGGWFDTHPGNNERSANLLAVAEEIRNKQIHGWPVWPD